MFILFSEEWPSDFVIKVLWFLRHLTSNNKKHSIFIFSALKVLSCKQQTSNNFHLSLFTNALLHYHCHWVMRASLTFSCEENDANGYKLECCAKSSGLVFCLICQESWDRAFALCKFHKTSQIWQNVSVCSTLVKSKRKIEQLPYNSFSFSFTINQKG